MGGERTVHGVRFVRPLLELPKRRLVATCSAAGVAFVEDPSNASDRFLRARIRRLMPELAAVGLTAERLAGTARRLARAAAAVDAMVADLGRAAVTDHDGVVSVDAGRLRAAPEEVSLRLLAELVRCIRPAAYLPRAAALEDWLAAFRAEPSTLRRRTVAGVVLDLRRGRLWLYAEAGRRGFPTDPVSGPGEHLWDGRIRVVLAGDVPDGLTCGPASGDRRRADLPKAAAASLPVVSGSGPDGGEGRRFTIAIEPLRRPAAAIAWRG
jgi:tRNA(Ile)-lysidine synthase